MSLWDREMAKPGAGAGIPLTEDEAWILNWAHRHGIAMPIAGAAELVRKLKELREGSHT